MIDNSKIEIRRSWESGPLREFADERPGNGWGMPYARGGFVGQYLCEACMKPRPGVYRFVNVASQAAATWICQDCRDRQTPKKPKKQK